ncbi:MAG: GFA family protein [Pseudomonadota bacterium]
MCHCTDCQTLSGSAFRVVVFCSEDSFKLTNTAKDLHQDR